MNPRTMQKRSTEAQIRKYGSLEAFREEMRRRASMRKKVGNFRKEGRIEWTEIVRGG